MADYKTLSDPELLQRLKESDHSAYTEIYNRYFSLIFVHACNKLEDEDQAKDTVQEVFATLWFKRESCENIKDLAPYLFTAVRNKIFDLFAHQQVRDKHYDSLQAFIESHPTISTDSKIREAQFLAYIDRQIDGLPPKMKLIFEMSRKQHLSYKEIAEHLNTSENNISKQVNSALRILRTKLSILLFFL